LINIAKTTLSSKLLNTEKNHFAELAVDAVLRLAGSGNLDYIQMIKKPGGTLQDSFLENGFVLDKAFGVGQVRRVENAKILVANTPMDTDKIKIYGSRVSKMNNPLFFLSFPSFYGTFISTLSFLVTSSISSVIQIP
jgi:T-complex protein 1 subunit beta